MNFLSPPLKFISFFSFNYIINLHIGVHIVYGFFKFQKRLFLLSFFKSPLFTPFNIKEKKRYNVTMFLFLF